MRIDLTTVLALALTSMALGACVAFLDDDRREGDACVRDTDCPPGCWCDEGTCVVGERPRSSGGGEGDGGGTTDPRPSPSCDDDWDCSAGFSCDAGRCQPTERYCGADADCGAGEICDDWTCQLACLSDAECGVEALCAVNGHCEPAPSVCNDLWDCAAGEVCVEGACESAEETCVSDWACGPGCVCLNEACVPERPCETAADCPSGYVCGAERACVWPAEGPAPEACAFDYECPAGLRCEEDGRCLDESGAIPCATSATCPSTGICVDGRCTPPSVVACFSRLDCAPDEVCVGGTCEPDDVAPGGGGDPDDEPTAIGDGLCGPGLACGGIEYCYDTCFTADCCTVVCNCDLHDGRLHCNLYCTR